MANTASLAPAATATVSSLATVAPSLTLELLSRIQNTYQCYASLERAHNRSLQSWRNQFVKYEERLQYIRNLESFCHGIDSNSYYITNDGNGVENNNDSSSNARTFVNPIEQSMRMPMKPFSYPTEQNYIQLISLVRNHPQLVSKALSSLSTDFLNTHRKYLASVCQAIILDIFSPDSTFTELALSSSEISMYLIYDYLATISSMSTSLLEHTSVPLKLLHEFNRLYGAKYIKLILSDSLNEIIAFEYDLSADLMDLRSTNSPKTSTHNLNTGALFDFCETMLFRIISSVEMLPLEIRSLARTLFDLTSKQLAFKVSVSTANQLLNDSATSLTTEQQHEAYHAVHDYLFMNWIVNAVMFPEMYSLSFVPISPLARRNLQAIGTVLIKLLTDFRAVRPLSKAESSPLQQFLTEWQPKLAEFMTSVITVSPVVPISTVELLKTAVPAASTVDLPFNNIIKSRQGFGYEDLLFPSRAVLRPNDLFMLHLCLHEWRKDVVEFGQDEVRKEREAAKQKARLAKLQAANKTISISDMTVTAPSFLSSTSANSDTTESSPRLPANGNSPAESDDEKHEDIHLNDCHIPSSVLMQLDKVLISLPKPTSFLSFNDNSYLTLSTGLPVLDLPSVDEFNNNTVDKRTELAIEIITRQLLPILTSSLSCQHLLSNSMDLPVLLNEIGDRSVSRSEFRNGLILKEAATLLLNLFPGSYDFTPILQHVLSMVLKRKHLFMSTSLSPLLIHCGNILEEQFENIQQRESQCLSILRKHQIKRLFDLLRPKLRRLKKFFLQRYGEKSHFNPLEPDVADDGKSNLRLSAGPANSSSEVVQCSSECPDNLATDRFVCSNCSQQLEKRRASLRSFYKKYIIGEENPGNSASASARTASTEKQTASPFGSPSSISPTPNNFVASSRVPNAANSSKQAIKLQATMGFEPGQGYLELQLGPGPPLDLRDSATASDILEIMVVLIYPELSVNCEKAENVWKNLVQLEKQVFPSFSRFYLYMRFSAENIDSVSSMEKMYIRFQTGETSEDSKNQIDDTEFPQGLQPGVLDKLKHLRIPSISSSIIDTLAAHFKLCFKNNHNFQIQMESLESFRSLLFAALTTSSWNSIRDSTSSAISTKILDDAANVDDYICLLSYICLHYAPMDFLSKITALRLFHPNSLANKSFADLCTAIKYLFQTHRQLSR